MRRKAVSLLGSRCLPSHVHALFVHAFIQESSTDPDVWIVPQTTGCQSKYDTYFSAVLYGIQGLMLAFGAFLAWETRQVR
jgi:hypothetical protein